MAKLAPHRVQSYRAQPHFIRPTAAALAVAACFSGPVLANPTGHTVVHGTASVQQIGNILNITNSHNAIINWGSFSIGVNELTRFIQPSALSAVLNRVIGQDPSAILGALQSNGRVFLLNPNGILFGAGAQINVAGLVASTLNLSNDDFLNNRMRFTDGAGAGSVVNQGSITGGNVYLVGKSVSNEGLITSPNGEVVLAAGNSVELVNPGSPNLRVEVVAPDNEARNLGTISAEAGRIGIYAGLIKQSGTLSADSAVSEGGRIVLKSTRKTLLEAGSVTSARGTSGGQIITLSSMTDGVTEVAGKMDASGTAGNGGFIETSAAKVKIADSATITAAGGGGGQAGTWLIDPSDFYIASSGGDISGATLASQLDAYGGTNITIATSSYGGGVGDLYVNDAVSWSSIGSLMLIAHNNVEVNSAITNGGTGGVNLYAGWDGVSMVTPIVGSSGAINLNAPISTLGDIKLVAGGNILQGAPGSLTAANLLASSNFGVVSLNNPGAVNMVGTIAGNARGSFAFKNSGNLTIGSTGITVNASDDNPATINVEVVGGTLTVNSPVYARGGDGSEGQAGGNATITLASSSSMQINSSINADGGEGGSGYSFSDAGPGGNATVNLTSGGGLTIAANVQATGGTGGTGYSFANGGRGGDGVVNATAAGMLTVAAYGGVVGQGGRGGYSYNGQAGRGGDGKVMLTAAGGITVASGSQIQGRGGDGGDGGSSYSYGGAGAGGHGGDGVVALTATGGNITVSGGTVHAAGGWGGSSYYGGGISGNGGNASVSLTSTAGAITISNNASVYADGGEGYYNAYNATGGTATVAINASGPITITDSYVSAQGGDGGESAAAFGGNAAVSLTSSGAITIESSSINAEGGEGGYYYGAGNGGTATIAMSASGPITINNSYVDARGGDGGEIGVGGNALVLISTSGGLTVSGSEVGASGGDAGSGGQGGAAALTMLAGGNIQMEGAEGSVAGGNGATGGNAALTMVAGGNITINSYYYNGLQADVSGDTPGLASVVLSAAGDVSLMNGAEVQSGGTVGLGGVNVVMDNAYVSGDTGVSVAATGSLSLMSSSLISGGSAFITTGGNVTVDGSSIYGNPEVVMNVGGVINMSNGGTIGAGSPQTIFVTFPMLASGGYFVDGVEGVVYDSGTGFVVLGNPAILGANLFILYGGGKQLDVPTDALIVAMGQSTEPPDPERDKNVFEDLKKDKEAPVCR